MKNNLIGERVKSARKNGHPSMTQKELSIKLQLFGFVIDRGGIAKIEAGLRRVTDMELVIISRALNVSTSWLLGETKSDNYK